MHVRKLFLFVAVLGLLAGLGPLGPLGPSRPPAAQAQTTDDYGEFTPLTPARILDTRNGIGGFNTPIGRASAIEVSVAGQGGVPTTGVTAVVMNVTATQASEQSFVSVYPAGALRPNSSTVNIAPNQNVPNLTLAKLGANGKVSVYNDSGTVHVLLDVVGWFSTGATAGTNARLRTTPPTRLVDTRNGLGGHNGPIGPNSSIPVQVTGQAGVPAGAVGVIANITIDQPTEGTFITVYPNDVAAPNASNLNALRGQTVPNLAMVRLASDGTMRIYNFAGNSHVIVDVVGYFIKSYPNTAGQVLAITPNRVLDTRPIGKLGSGIAQSVNTGVQNASGLIANITVTNPTEAGFFTVYPEAASPPTASNLNFRANQTVANLVVVQLPPSKVVYGFNYAGSIDVIVDIVGLIS